MPASVLSRSLVVLALTSAPLAAQDLAADAPRGGSEFWIPFGSFFVPGLGQYIHGEPWVGLAYTGTAVAGVAAGIDAPSLSLLPRDSDEQLSLAALQLAGTAGMLSAWDAFHRPMPALRGAGKYGFLEAEEDLGDLLTAPFDFRFLGRWTTWIDLAFTGFVTAWVLENRNEGAPHPPFRGHDAAFAGSLSLNAAVGEEALFRGWLLPMLTEKSGRFWVANGLQAAIFGSLHTSQADEFALVIGLGGFYNGWVTRRNGWSIREVIFQHFWYDVAVITAELLRDDSRTVTLMPIRIRF
jgi:membrane protease YdiL (CAAX protease family)